MTDFFLMTLIGLGVGVFGTLVGAGGGFILIPVLVLMNPGADPDYLTTVSLSVVFFNALSGTIAYARMRRIHYRAGIFFAAAAIPGAILGALTVHFMPRKIFDIILGIFMLVSSVYLFFSQDHERAAEKAGTPVQKSEEEGGRPSVPPSFPFNAPVGIGLSVLIGYISSLLGIGGGIIHVPVLARVLRFPVHVSTATSHFILAIMTFVGAATHFVENPSYHYNYFSMLLPLSVGVAAGAQAGAYLSTKISSVWIMRSLAAALVFVAIRVLVLAALMR